MQSNKFLYAFIYGAVLLILIAGSSLLLAQQEAQDKQEQQAQSTPQGFGRFAGRGELRAQAGERRDAMEAWLEQNPEAAALMNERRELQQRHSSERDAWNSRLQSYMEAHPEAEQLFSRPQHGGPAGAGGVSASRFRRPTGGQTAD